MPRKSQKSTASIVFVGPVHTINHTDIFEQLSFDEQSRSNRTFPPAISSYGTSVENKEGNLRGKTGVISSGYIFGNGRMSRLAGCLVNRSESSTNTRHGGKINKQRLVSIELTLIYARCLCFAPPTILTNFTLDTVIKIARTKRTVFSWSRLCKLLGNRKHVLTFSR